jgi:hypothetical protein
LPLRLNTRISGVLWKFVGGPIVCRCEIHDFATVAAVVGLIGRCAIGVRHDGEARRPGVSKGPPVLA